MAVTLVMSITEINEAANNFLTCPPAKVIQLTMDRHVKISARKAQIPSPRPRAGFQPFRAMQTTPLCISPTIPPDIKAVFAFMIQANDQCDGQIDGFAIQAKSGFQPILLPPLKRLWAFERLAARESSTGRAGLIKKPPFAGRLF
jgi:hypothetical protein